MRKQRTVGRIGLIGSYLPRPCGIATFSGDVYEHLSAARPDWDIAVMAINDGATKYDYPDEVRFEMDQSVASYRAAAAWVEAHHFDGLFLQHEFGLFGGHAGDRLFEMLDRVRAPLVTMMHTVLKDPDEHQFRVTRRLAARSSKLITMSERGRTFLREVYEIDERKIAVVPHGIPDTQYAEPSTYQREFDLVGRKVALTFGLISPGKGLENAIAAMPAVVEKHPDLTYVVLGATHPHLKAQQGETYRDSLETMVGRLGIGDNVRFVNRFVELDELTRWLGVADVYITPYLNEAQITSGTLAYAFGSGKAVISTPYWHAADLLAGGRGRLVPFGDTDAIAEQLNDLLDHPGEMGKLQKAAYLEGRQMIWPVVAHRMAEIVELAHNRMFTHVGSTHAPPTLAGGEGTLRGGRLPTGGRHDARLLADVTSSEGDEQPMSQNLDAIVRVSLQHLRRLSDDVGLIQHATFDTPNRHEGYCTDDNTRALLLMLHLQRGTAADGSAAFDSEIDRQIESLASRYRAFVDYSINPATGSIRNFMSYDRRWLETRGSDDCIGRVAWTLGACVDWGNADVSSWAANHFDSVLQQCARSTSPRTWSFAVLGACHYQKQFAGERNTTQVLNQLVHRLVDLHDRVADAKWNWLEESLTYDNAKIPHALIVAGRMLDQPEWIDRGSAMLRWVCRLQTSPEGYFRPIGNTGFYNRGERLPTHDQQPLEAWATLSACLEAFDAQREDHWIAEAQRSLGWFLGCNDLGTSLVDIGRGACHDGLQFDRVNRNQGAESTLAWLLAATEWINHRRRRAAVTTDSQHVGGINLPIGALDPS